jgi:hypothetical protein
MTDGHFFYNI